MKVFFRIFIILLSLFFLSAHTSHYKNLKKIEMEIFRNNELIGFNYYFFTRNKDITKVTNKIKFTVKLLGATIFEVDGYGEEKYNKNDLTSFISKTKQNNKEKFVNLELDEEKNEFIIKGSSYTGKAKTRSVVGNWWNHELLQAESQISPMSGSIKKQVTTFVAKEKIELYGKNIEAEHFKLTINNKNLTDDKKLSFDIWLDKKTRLILKVKYSKMGDWEYRLKSYE